MFTITSTCKNWMRHFSLSQQALQNANNIISEIREVHVW